MLRLLRETTLQHMSCELHAGVSVAFLAASCLCCFFSWLVLMGELVKFVGLAVLAPQPCDTSFDEWWSKDDQSVTGDMRKGLNSLIILGSWTIWRHRNDCVFNGATPSIAAALVMAKDEAHLWSMSGAKGLSLLTTMGVG